MAFSTKLKPSSMASSIFNLPCATTSTGNCNSANIFSNSAILPLLLLANTRVRWDTQPVDALCHSLSKYQPCSFNCRCGFVGNKEAAEGAIYTIELYCA